MPDLDNLNSLMNSDGYGGVKYVQGRSNGWSHSTEAPLGTNQQSISGTYMNNGRIISATIIVESKLGFDNQDASFIVSWFFNDGELHQSAKVKGAPAGFKGYLHDYGRNKLFAITNVDEAGRVITIPTTGKVNDGWHNF